MRTIVAIVIATAGLWFALTNTAAVTLHLLMWDVTASLAIVVGVAFLLGFLLGLLRLAPSFFRSRRKARSVTKTLADTQKERDALAERSNVLESQIHQLAPIQRPTEK